MWWKELLLIESILLPQVVLQEREIERLGGDRSIKLNVRVISATNRNLQDMIDKGTFREDLYYRLNVIPIHIPPLRERKADIPILVQHFIDTLGKELGKAHLKLDPGALEEIMDHDWPGNVRELENCIEYAVNFESGSKITINNIPEKIIGKNAAAGQGIRLTLKEIEDRYIKSVMAQFPEDKAQAAEILGIDVSTLYRKIKKS